MRLSPAGSTAIVAAALGLCALAQTTTPTNVPSPTPSVGMPPRATPTDYPSQGRAGSLTIAAEFMGHSVPKPEGPLSTEDYVVIETGFFGPAGQRINLSVDDFSLRVNGKKTPLSSQPFGFVVRTVKDPEWVPPDQPKEKASKGGLSTGGQDANAPPPIVHVPIELQRAMAQYIQKSALPQGDRALPTAGLIYFEYRGKLKGIHSLELIYAGAAGKTTLALQP